MKTVMQISVFLTEHNYNRDNYDYGNGDDDDDDETNTCWVHTGHLIDILQILLYFAFSTYLNTCFETQIPENNGLKSAYTLLSTLFLLPYKIPVQRWSTQSSCVFYAITLAYNCIHEIILIMFFN